MRNKEICLTNVFAQSTFVETASSSVPLSQSDRLWQACEGPTLWGIDMQGGRGLVLFTYQPRKMFWHVSQAPIMEAWVRLTMDFGLLEDPLWLIQILIFANPGWVATSQTPPEMAEFLPNYMYHTMGKMAPCHHGAQLVILTLIIFTLFIKVLRHLRPTLVMDAP